MAKLVLIDPSITDVGGHYYEYAVRVLQAAEEAGFEPILATNRDVKVSEPLRWRVVAAYRYDFFQPGPPRLLQTGRQWLRGLRRFAARQKYRWLFSRFGVLWSRRREGAAGLAACVNSRRLLVAAALAEGLLYLVRLAVAVGHLALTIIPLSGYLRSVGRALRHLFGVAARPWRALLAHGAVAWQQMRFWRKRNAFASDSLRLFSQVALQHGDHVFIPTLTEADMLGLVSLFAKNRDTAKATWHLVFRRNIYQGREPDYTAQEEALRPLRNAFRQFQAQLHGQRVHFYTDTDPLTFQYNRLGVASFSTVGIPVATDYAAEVPPVASGRTVCPTPFSEQNPLHVVYIGDARSEKGYHWLPHLVGDAVASNLPVRFTFQSNFNVPGGEPAPAVARAQLEGMPSANRVELRKQPLGSPAYRRLLLDADVVVIPYDRDNYYARSSGIFAEALVAAKPVIVPAGTWMAAEMASSICAYHDALRHDHRVLRSLESRDLAWKTPLGKLADGRHWVSDEGLPVLGRSPTCCWLNVPADATHLLVSLEVGGQGRGIFPGVATEHFGQGRTLLSRTFSVVGGTPDQRASALVCIGTGTRRMRLALSNALSTLPAALGRVQLDFLRATHALPASAIGAIYAEPNELSGHLREILTHYDHYRATAADFSRSWSAYHCPQSLLEKLVGMEQLEAMRCTASHAHGAAEMPATSADHFRRAA